MGARDELYGEDPGDPHTPAGAPQPPVPQMENQLVEACPHLDLHIPKQVIEVPKISFSSRRSRRRRVPLVQTAEQLVEVRTIVSYSLVHGLVEQNTWTFQFLMVVAVGGGLQGLRPGQNSAAFCGAEHVDFQFHMVVAVAEVFKVSSPAASSSHSAGAADEVFTGFLHFSQNKKSARLGPHS